MVDGSKLSFHDNIQFTRTLARAAHAKGMLVEAELGRLSGTEDGLTVEEYEALLTDTKQVRQRTHVPFTNPKSESSNICVHTQHLALYRAKTSTEPSLLRRIGFCRQRSFLGRQKWMLSLCV